MFFNDETFLYDEAFRCRERKWSYLICVAWLILETL